MPKSHIIDLIEQLAGAIAVDDNVTLLDVADELAQHIGQPATVALTRALVIELRASTTSLQLQTFRPVKFA